MKKLISMATLLMFIMTGSVMAQKIRVESGNVKPILSEKEINIQYDYSNMKIGKDKTEEEYIKEKVAEHNADEPGKGDKWRDGWINSRKTRYEPKFEELINKMLEEKGIKHGNYPSAKYTLIVKTIHTEPGFNVGMMKRPSFVSFEFTYVETAQPTNVVCKMSLLQVPGSQAMGFDYDAGSRIAESYAKAGKVLGKHIND